MNYSGDCSARWCTLRVFVRDQTNGEVDDMPSSRRLNVLNAGMRAGLLVVLSCFTLGIATAAGSSPPSQDAPWPGPFEKADGCVSYPSTNVPRDISDDNETLSTLTVPDSLVISDVDVTVDIEHTYDEDLDAVLKSPSGATVVLFSGVGAGGDNFTNTTFDDEAAAAIASGSAPFAGTFRPQAALDAFDGENAAGQWTLSVYDNASGYTGRLNSWGLCITGNPAEGEGEGEGEGECPNPPANPLNVTASDGVFTDRVRVFWDLVEGATDYRVYRSDTAGVENAEPVSDWVILPLFDDFTALPPTANPAVTCIGGAELPLFHVYYYWVRTRDAEGCISEFSSDPEQGFIGQADYVPAKASAASTSPPWGGDMLALGVASVMLLGIRVRTSARTKHGSPLG